MGPDSIETLPTVTDRAVIPVVESSSAAVAVAGGAQGFTDGGEVLWMPRVDAPASVGAPPSTPPETPTLRARESHRRVRRCVVDPSLNRVPVLTSHPPGRTGPRQHAAWTAEP